MTDKPSEPTSEEVKSGSQIHTMLYDTLKQILPSRETAITLSEALHREVNRWLSSAVALARAGMREAAARYANVQAVALAKTLKETKGSAESTAVLKAMFAEAAGIEQHIRALAPDDCTDALEKYKAEAVSEATAGMREAAILAACWQCRAGHKPVACEHIETGGAERFHISGDKVSFCPAYPIRALPDAAADEALEEVKRKERLDVLEDVLGHVVSPHSGEFREWLDAEIAETRAPQPEKQQ